MFRCPICRSDLDLEQERGLWICRQCGGAAAGGATMRKLLSPAWWTRLRELCQSGRATRTPKICPACPSGMMEVQDSYQGHPTTTDVCPSCFTVWLGAEERGLLLPNKPVPMTSSEWAPPAAGRPRMPAWSADRNRAWSAGATVPTPPTSAPETAPDPIFEEPIDLDSLPPYKKIPLLLGFPVAQEEASGSSWLVWVVAIITIAFGVMTFPRLLHAIDAWGCVPDKAFRSGGLTILSSFFVHGGWGHLLGNMYFLILFGARTEWAIGALKTILLLGVSQILGVATHGMWDPRRDMPLIGASAAVSGVMAFYALAFPKERFLYRIIFIFVVRPRALTLIGFWVVLQFLNARSQMVGLSSVSALGHLGGVVGGILVWYASGRPSGRPDGSISYEDV